MLVWVQAGGVKEKEAEASWINMHPKIHQPTHSPFGSPCFKKAALECFGNTRMVLESEDSASCALDNRR